MGVGEFLRRKIHPSRAQSEEERGWIFGEVKRRRRRKKGEKKVGRALHVTKPGLPPRRVLGVYIPVVWVVVARNSEEKRAAPTPCWRKKKKILFSPFFFYFFVFFSPPDGRYTQTGRSIGEYILPPTFWTELLLPSPSQGTRSCGIESQGGILGPTLLSRLTLDFSRARSSFLHTHTHTHTTRTQSSVRPSGSAARFFVPSRISRRPT